MLVAGHSYVHLKDQSSRDKFRSKAGRCNLCSQSGSVV